MGFFGGTKISVASSVYNLAGDEEEVPSYLKTVVTSHTLSKRSRSISESLTSAYMGGPGMSMSRFYNWAQRRYPQYMMTGVKSLRMSTVSSQTLAQSLPIPGLTGNQIRSVEADFGEYSYWAEKWVIENHESRLQEDWLAEMPNGPRGGLSIAFEDGEVVRAPKSNLDENKAYLYVTYQEPETDKLKMHIYQQGSGVSTLDSAVSVVNVVSDYYPILPVRLNNKFVSNTYKKPYYEYSKKGLKKLGRINIDDIIEKLADNESLDDIDYAFVAMGVPLNTKVMIGKEYIYKFFQSFLAGGATNLSAWVAAQAAAETSYAAWEAWDDAGRQGAEPALLGLPAAPKHSFKLTAPGLDYSISLSWNRLVETVGSGLAKPGAKAGELWWDDGELYPWRALVRLKDLGKIKINNAKQEFTFTWQETPDRWRKLSITGLTHKNFIYKDKFVELGPAEALTDNELSGLFIPMRQDVLKRMSLVKATQLSSTSILLVINAYVVKKVKWYQTGFFKLILVVAIVVTMVFTGGITAGTVGVLGTAAAVGTAVGLTGIAAVIAGALINAIAAAIITSIITAGATALLGDKVGQIVGLVSSMIALNAMAGFASTGSFAIDWSQFAKVDRIIQMTSAVGNTAANIVRSDTADLIADTERMLGEYEDKMDEISKAFAENIGYGNGVIDPMQFLSSVGPVEEKPEEFLTRTLMTGSDIAELTKSLVSNFADISLDLNKIA